jgi:hypothetical protein
MIQVNFRSISIAVYLALNPGEIHHSWTDPFSLLHIDPQLSLKAVQSSLKFYGYRRQEPAPSAVWCLGLPNLRELGSVRFVCALARLRARLPARLAALDLGLRCWTAWRMECLKY